MAPNKSEYEKLLPEIRTLTDEVVKQNMADGILFSAGVDTSIIAYYAVKYKPKIPALTLSFKHGQPKDTEYVKKMVDFLHLQHEFHTFDREDVVTSAEKIVEVLKIFDPMEIRNAVSVYIGLTIAKIEGIKSVFTGDGVDELFGYPWMWRLSETELTKKFKDMWGEMGFSSIPMGKSIGVEVKPPFLDPLFMDYAKKLPNNLKINEENGVKYSKWILRKAYEDLIPKDVIWRPKAPLEQGTGTTVLTDYFGKEISDKEFAERRKQVLLDDDVFITSKEQLFYYDLFRKHFAKPSSVYNERIGQQCPQCKSYVKTELGFCKVCGNYPI
ncbi:MAG: asparagine synthase C-terminal domain-containing protein [Candidatus Bathyarchaeia archaeon]